MEIEQLYHLFSKWKLNHNLFASLLDMHKGTFNNKLNPDHRGSFKQQEILKLKKILSNMNKDIDNIIKSYIIIDDEDLTGNTDEQSFYNRL